MEFLELRKVHQFNNKSIISIIFFLKKRKTKIHYLFVFYNVVIRNWSPSCIIPSQYFRSSPVD